MMRLYTSVLMTCFCVLCMDAMPVAGESLKMNCSDRYWYPFLYTVNGHVEGILYDIVNKAFESLKIKAVVEPVPSRRAIVNARKGRADGIIAVGFRPDLREVLDYPPGADRDTESPWRIMQVDHVVVSFAKSDYEFEGDLKTLPAPVRLLQGAPIADDLSEAGIDVQEVREDVQNFLKLIRDENGVTITTSVAAEMRNRDPRFKERIKIHATPVASHSYYLAFSKKSSLAPDDKMRIWKEIVKWRDDYVFMLQVFSRH